MEEAKKTMDRRQFTTLAAALAALSGVAITISGCGGGSSPTSSSGTGTGGSTGGGGGAPVSGDKTGTISNDHGHSAVITAAQLTAGGALNLDIQGTSSHPHSVQLSGAQVASIASGQRVSTDSTNNGGHTHTVTFN